MLIFPKRPQPINRRAFSSFEPWAFFQDTHLVTRAVSFWGFGFIPKRNVDNTVDCENFLLHHSVQRLLCDDGRFICVSYPLEMYSLPISVDDGELFQLLVVQYIFRRLLKYTHSFSRRFFLFVFFTDTRFIFHRRSSRQANPFSSFFFFRTYVTQPSVTRHTCTIHPKVAQTKHYANTSYISFPPFPISIVTILRFFAAGSAAVASVQTCTTSSSSQSPVRVSWWTATRSRRPPLS